MANLSSLTRNDLTAILLSGSYNDNEGTITPLTNLLADDNFKKNPKLYDAAKSCFSAQKKIFANSTDNATKYKSMSHLTNAYSVLQSDIDSSPLKSNWFRRLFGSTLRHKNCLNNAEALFSKNLQTFVAVKKPTGKIQDFAKQERFIKSYLTVTKKGLKEWQAIKKELVKGNESSALVKWNALSKKGNFVNPEIQQLVTGTGRLSNTYLYQNALGIHDKLTLNLYARESLIEQHAAKSEKVQGLWISTQIALTRNTKEAKRLTAALFKEIKANPKTSPTMLMAETLLAKSAKSKQVKTIVEACTTAKKPSTQYLKLQEQRIEKFFVGFSHDERTMFAAFINKMGESNINYFNFLLDNGITFATFSEKRNDPNLINNIRTLTTGSVKELNRIFSSKNYNMINFAIQRPALTFGPSSLLALPFSVIIAALDSLKIGKKPKDILALDGIKTVLELNRQDTITRFNSTAEHARKGFKGYLDNINSYNEYNNSELTQITINVLEEYTHLVYAELNVILHPCCDLISNNDSILNKPLKDFIETLQDKCITELSFTAEQNVVFDKLENFYRTKSNSVNYKTIDTDYAIKMIDYIKSISTFETLQPVETN